MEIKFGVVVPRDTMHALELDKESGNTYWHDAIDLEVNTLMSMDCFEFHNPSSKPSSDYQWTKLTMFLKSNKMVEGKPGLLLEAI
jgi:hypothetical protein